MNVKWPKWKYESYIKSKSIYWIYCIYLNLGYVFTLFSSKRTLQKNRNKTTCNRNVTENISRFFNIFYWCGELKTTSKGSAGLLKYCQVESYFFIVFHTSFERSLPTNPGFKISVVRGWLLTKRQKLQLLGLVPISKDKNIWGGSIWIQCNHKPTLGPCLQPSCSIILQ